MYLRLGAVRASLATLGEALATLEETGVDGGRRGNLKCPGDSVVVENRQAFREQGQGRKPWFLFTKLPRLY